MRIPPYNWPEGKKCAILIAVLFDDGLDAIAQAPDLVNRPKSFSVWEYGAKRGVERLLATLADFDCLSSWFIPGAVAEKHQALVEKIAAQGHEVAARGWHFESYDRLDEQETCFYLRRSRQIMKEISGQVPRGFCLPIGRWPIGFDKLLQRAGFDWSSCLNGDDRPYNHPSGLVEIPIHRELEDRPYFQFNFAPPFPKGLSRLPSYDAVLANWLAEFDAYRAHGLCFVLQLRPEMIATPGRIFILRQLLQHIKSFDDVWLATGSMIADGHRFEKEKKIEGRPLDIFATYRRENGYHDAE